MTVASAKPAPLVSSVVVVAVGGAAGSLLRWSIGLVWSSTWVTVVINVVGSLLLGLLMGVLSRSGRSSLWRPLLGIGVLGGFTTFSTAMVNLWVDVDHGRWWQAMVAVLIAAVGSLLAAGLGWRLASRATDVVGDQCALPLELGHDVLMAGAPAAGASAADASAADADPARVARLHKT